MKQTLIFLILLTASLTAVNAQSYEATEEEREEIKKCEKLSQEDCSSANLHTLTKFKCIFEFNNYGPTDNSIGNQMFQSELRTDFKYANSASEARYDVANANADKEITEISCKRLN